MKAVITDHGFPDLDAERAVFANADIVLEVAQCRSAADVVAASRDADALLVQFAPVTRDVIAQLDHCKAIVRYGIGVDNIDIAAATERRIAVCNVPDYCVDEVADHSLALALSLGRQLPQIDGRVRSGTWKVTPDRPMAAFREMTFATLGFGRIARAVLERARAFNFSLAAYDPYIPESVFEAASVARLDLDELFAKADILSLHLPLSDESRHIVNQRRLGQMKPTATIVNTARGPLIDTKALAHALQEGAIAGAGIDVFEAEPLEPDHPIRRCKNAILTSHVGWCSTASVALLQRKAAEEVVRALTGIPLCNQINSPRRNES